MLGSPVLVLLRSAVFVALAASCVRAQLTLENPKHLDVPEQQAKVLFLTTTRVMETEFHSPGALENKFHVKLVLGDAHERFTIDDPAGNGTIYLERWNEGKFAVSLMRLAVQHLLVPDRQQRMLMEIVRRAHEIAPVSATRLAEEHPESAPSLPLSPFSVHDDCLSGITNAGLRAPNCKPVPVTPR